MVDINTCAPNISTRTHWTCFTLNELKEIANAFNIYIEHNKTCKKSICPNLNIIRLENKSKSQLWKSIYNRLKPICKYESCWIDLDFIKQIDDLNLREKIKYFTFKPKMTKHLNKWLNTKDINAVLQQYQEVHKSFKFLGALPSDFYKIIKVKWTDLYKYHTIGIIFNLDDHTQSGSHWVSFLIDNKIKTIEYYDSVGDNPNANIQEFINKISKLFKHKYNVKINTIKHQYGNSECGVYAMYYIVQRLSGNSFKTITSNIIKDNEIKKFRKHFFIQLP
jgi:hypothetical protein